MVSVLKGTLSCTLMLNAFALVLRGSVIAATRDGFPPNFVELECGVHAIALQFGVSATVEWSRATKQIFIVRRSFL